MALGTSILRTDITVGQRETTTGRTARGGRGTAGQRNLIDFAGIHRALRRHWKALVASMLAGVLLAGLWSLTQTKLYAAEASGIVSTGTTENIGLGMAADAFAKSKATQYKVLAESAVVRDAALKEAGLEPGAGSVAVAVPLDTAELRFRVVRDNPADAAKLANAYVTALADSVSDIENQTTDGSEPEKDQPQSVVKILPFVRADPPLAASYPPTALAIAAGLLVGLLAGIAYVALRSLYDRRIRDVATLEEDFGLPVVGIIPMHSQAGTRRLGSNQDARRRDAQSKPLLATTEAIKGLRTNLQFMNPDDPPRVICITSPLPSEGKSTVAASLAEAIAVGGQEVVLVDGDLRRPTVAKSFYLVEDVGLTDVVVGRADLHDVIQEVPDTLGMKVLGAGQIPPNPSEILSSDRLRHLLHELARTAIVIIDAPPLLPVTDAAILAGRFDGALLVVQAGSSTTDEVKRALVSLERVHAKVLGAVLNRVPTGKSDGYGYGYYGSYYASDSEQTGKKSGSTSDPATGRNRKRRSSSDRHPRAKSRSRS